MSELYEEELRESFCEYRQGLHGICSCKEVPVFSRSVDLVEYNTLTKEITAIEFKISDWKRALNQLKSIDTCFDFLVLCIPKPKTDKCMTNIIGKCDSMGIGLYLWDKEDNHFYHQCIEKNHTDIWNIQKENIIEYLSETRFSMNKNLRLLRYNTGTDKQIFIKFKDDVSAVIFNATIVAYSGSAVADLVSVHKNQYIIDPQTHIFQQKIEAIQTKDKNGTVVVKKSVAQYLNELPEQLTTAYYNQNGELTPLDISKHIDSLVDAVYCFETKYVDKYIKKKDYDKYLEYVNLGPSPRVVIAPYFMFKSSYSDDKISLWMQMNKNAAERFIEKNNGLYPVGLQLVLDKDVLERDTFIAEVEKTYQMLDAEYVFIWIDEYNGFEATTKQQKQFKALLQVLTKNKLKPIMAYGGYDSVLLCSSDLSYRLYGVAHSVGYGESRPITPVGGGLPVNKFYFPPLHNRMNMVDVVPILRHEGLIPAQDNEEAAKRFYREICDCRQCKAIVKNNIDNFYEYNESIPFVIKGTITRNRPTTEASHISAMHFMYSKCREWELVEKYTFKQLTQMLMKAYSRYERHNYYKISEWCKVYDE